MSREKRILEKAETTSGRGWEIIKKRFLGEKAFEPELEWWVWERGTEGCCSQRGVTRMSPGGGNRTAWGAALRLQLEGRMR